MAISNKQYEEKLKELREKEIEDLAKILAQKYGLRYADLTKMAIDLDALKIIPEGDSREGKMAAFQIIGKKISIGVLNPGLLKTKYVLETLDRRGFAPDLFVVSELSLARAWLKYKEIPVFVEIKSGMVEIPEGKLSKFKEEINSLQSFQKILSERLEAKEKSEISELLELVLAGGLNLDSSDIHIEPEEKKAGLRIRLDGILYPVAYFPNDIYKLLISRIKLVSELKLNVKDRAQDGRFTFRAGETDIEIRTSILPGPYGESASLRILNPKTIGLNFENLGMNPVFLEIMDRELKKPNGMILTTGPTGSGKTTTLYAFLKKIKGPDIKIITIEDPIEYHIQGITQTQVDPGRGYDFTKGLRSVLRQDPDAILIGEIRDLETAETALRAALTGHLVFSTLHTNDAPGVIPRLIDLGAKPPIIAPAINIAMAQRLVRQLCKYCRKEKKPDSKEKKMIEENLEKIPTKYKKEISREFAVFEPAGCEKCVAGYKGRIGIFEAILIDNEVEKLIMKGPSEADMREFLKKQEMLTMFEDGILKILKGLTSFEEVVRVVGV